MSDDKLKKNKFRLMLWGVAAVLSAISLLIFIFNYQTLEEVIASAERSAVKQARNFRFYVNEYNVTKVALNEANQKLEALTKELEQANHDLTQTRSELTAIQEVNDLLKNNIASLERYKEKAAQRGEALESMINALKNKNKMMDAELQTVRKQLSVFQPDINDVNEGRVKIKMYKDHIRAVKENMHVIRRQADAAREAAQKEHDRLELLYGNGGYMVKDGQNKSVPVQGQKKVEIDVNFVNQ